MLAGLLVGAHKPGKGMADRDQDRIPDQADPFPDDPDRPGQALPETVYAHSSATLFTVDRSSGQPTTVADFSFADGTSRQVTDIAIDRWGVMWAVAFGDFHTCHPRTGRCETIGRLPGSFNALTIVDPELFGGVEDGLFGVTTDGAWYRIGRDGSATALGHHGGSSSGDAYHVGVSVMASRDAGGPDELIALDPRQRDSVRSLGSLPHHEMYGFAACGERVFGFDSAGSVHRLRGERFERVSGTGIAWWGAACSGPRIEFERVTPPPGPREPKVAPGGEPGEPAPDPAAIGCGCS